MVSRHRKRAAREGRALIRGIVVAGASHVHPLISFHLLVPSTLGGVGKYD